MILTPFTSAAISQVRKEFLFRAFFNFQPLCHLYIHVLKERVKESFKFVFIAFFVILILFL